MTLTGPLGSVLLCGPRPSFTCNRVVISPPAGVSFDGDRWTPGGSIHVVEGETSRTRSLMSFAAARTTAIREIEEVSPELVLLESPRTIRLAFPDDRGRRFTRGIRATAFTVGATVVGWQREPASPRDRRRYHMVVDRSTAPDPRGWLQGNRRRRRSNSPDTGP